MNRLISILIVCALFQNCTRWDTPPRVLVFSKTTGYRHESIEAGKEALVKICLENGILADTTENADDFNEKNLKRYAAVVFLNTNGEVLDPRQEADFERYIQAGGGFVGIHSASATEYTWRWYGGLVGGYFKHHPPIRDIDLYVENCPTNNCEPWHWKDEVYYFRSLEPDLEWLLRVKDDAADEAPHPLAWRHEYDGGRAFYTALGHIPASYSAPVFQRHLLDGLRYAIGKNRPLNYGRCRTQRAPDPTRFVKTVLASDLHEPMEIAQFPDGKIILIERHGQIKLFNPTTGLLNTVTKLPVYSEMGDGLLGVAIDPHWHVNRWIYLYYSSLKDSMNQLSRFVFQGDTLDRASETVLLTIPVGHKDCFHAAGSLTFDAEGNLFLATGDNTSPFASDGFAPIDERRGREAFDAQRSAANTNDLRGKILRIKPSDDGGYVCPAGNLFAKKDLRVKNGAAPDEQQGGRPEIYVMGCRNPFRISYDERRQLLFWGDIGPDAWHSDTARGPMGFDEINRAREAGNYGWPYFVADNQPYRAYDFSTQQSGAFFASQNPVNDSPNNTGAQMLPPAQPAFIWYPYSKIRDFPNVGTGGRNAMAGPVYYCDKYPEATRFPTYFDGKLIIYDWMRNWLMAVTLDSLGDFYRLEPFADSVPLSRPMDMLLDQKSGSLWVLEYGTRWYSSNEDARLSRIDFVQGNRHPIAMLEANKTACGTPCEVVFSFSKSKDYDGDKLTYQLDFGDASPLASGSFVPARLSEKNGQSTTLDTRRKGRAGQSGEVGVVHVFPKPGVYEATLTVTDAHGATATARKLISVGNEPPRVWWDLGGRNRSFYRAGDTLHYRLAVDDREDGSLSNGGIAPHAISTSVEYLEKGINPAALAPTPASTAQPEKYAEGKRLVEQSDCKSCHTVDRQINGPSFQAVAERYRNNIAFAVPSIYRKIIYGGGGNWGASYMTPHPQIREEEAIQMSLWILSLGAPPKPVQSLPLEGRYVLAGPTGAYLLKAAYRDRGHQGLPPLEGSETLILRPAVLQAEKCDERSEGVSLHRPFDNDTVVLRDLKHNAWFAFRHVDLAGLKSLVLRLGFGDSAGGLLELRTGSPDGSLLGTLHLAPSDAQRIIFEEMKIALPANRANGCRAYCDLFFVFKNKKEPNRGVVCVDWVRFDW
ncbi:MAG: ThuA domain-containing protein [Saprospiraceae bacterium]|nr:ThuA domain-containing protein [Saprospiraceae bacterium]